MCNVWFLLSCEVLKVWLMCFGFVDCKIVDVSVMFIEEQCVIFWMINYFLVDFFDFNDYSKIIEGYFVFICVVIIVIKK